MSSLEKWSEAVASSHLPGNWLLHGPERSGKHTAIQSLQRNNFCHVFQVIPDVSFFEQGDTIVESVKEIMSLYSFDHRYICIERVDLLHMVHQKALLSLLELGTASFVLSARNTSHCAAPLKSRCFLIRCPQKLEPAMKMRPMIQEILAQDNDDAAKSKIIDLMLQGMTSREIVREMSLIGTHEKKLASLVGVLSVSTMDDDDFVPVLAAWKAYVTTK